MPAKQKRQKAKGPPSTRTRKSKAPAARTRASTAPATRKPAAGKAPAKPRTAKNPASKARKTKAKVAPPARRAAAETGLKARLEQREAELAIINSVQSGLAAQLDIQAIFDLVGDKVRDTFNAQSVSIYTYDAKTNLMHFRYIIERGQRQHEEPMALRGFGAEVIRTRQPLLINEGMAARRAELGSVIVGGGQHPLSGIWVPMIVGGEGRGIISIQNVDREHAFSDSDFRLLITLAGSLSVAFENARLFDETQRLLKETEQRNAELAVINSIQQGVGAELNFQAIVDLVGDKLREVFKTGDMGILWRDEEAGLVKSLYSYEHGVRQELASFPENRNRPMHAELLKRQPVVVNNRVKADALGVQIIAGTDRSKSAVFVPMFAGERFLGSIILESFEREDAFGEAEVRLLSTVASSMGVALENARLFDETQRLLKETEQRNAELAVINSIQQGVGAELNFQAIVDLVGDKLREVFRTGDIGITWHDEDTGLVQFLYSYERGVRQYLPSFPENRNRPLHKELLKRQPVVANNRAEADALGVQVAPGTERSKCQAFVPMFAGDRLLGTIILENYEREDAFGEAEVRLLSTVAAGMGVALENARLFDETQRLFKESEQRAAELAIINSVQAALAAELNMQGIYDAVGDKIREIFNQSDLSIRIWDQKTGLVHFPYTHEHGERVAIESHPLPPNGFGPHVLRTRETLVINEKMLEESAKYGSFTIPGTQEIKSAVFVPLVSGEQARGLINLMNSEREHAYGDSDVRLLQTLANSMSGGAGKRTPLRRDPAPLQGKRAAGCGAGHHQQRAGSARGRTQHAGHLRSGGRQDPRDLQPRGRRHPHLRWQRRVDPFPVLYESGKRLKIDSAPMVDTGFSAHVLRTRETLVINENMEQAVARFGSSVFPGTQMEKSAVYVPMVSGNQVRGLILLSDFDREHAFGASDVRLLQTLANSMSVALENARLFDETQRLYKESEQRAAELAIINSVQAALAAELNMQGIYDSVGDKIREIFNQADIGIRIYDPRTNLLHYPYVTQHGKRMSIASHALNKTGFAAHVMRTREALVISENMAEALQKFGSFVHPGTQMDKSAVGVPLVVGDQARGMIELSDMEREHAFGESDVRLLQTLAGAMSVALENARLFDETQRLFKESEQRAAELAIINSVQQALAAELNMQGIYDAVGDKIREIFKEADVGIRIYNPQTGIVSFPYSYENGARIEVEPHPMRDYGFFAHMVRTRETMVVNENMAETMAKHGAQILPGTQQEKSFVLVPLISGDQVRGTIDLLDMNREHAFSASDVRLLQTLAGSMSVALENARLFDETQRRTREAAALAEVGRDISSTLDLATVMDRIARHAKDLLGADNSAIFLPDTDSKAYRAIVAVGGIAEAIKATSVTPGAGIIGSLVKSGKAEFINDTGADPRTIQIAGTEEVELERLMVAPLMAGKAVKGVMAVWRTAGQPFDDTDLQFIVGLSLQAAVAIENARLFAESQQRAAELNTVNTVSQQLAGKLDLSALIALVGEQIRNVFDADLAYVALLDRATGMIDFPYQYGESIAPMKYGEGLTSKIIKTGKALIINEDTNRRSQELGARIGGRSAKSYMGVPIMVNGAGQGVISVQSTEREGVYDEADERLLSTIAANVGVALQNARLFNETRVSLERQTATADILKVIARSPSDVQPVLDAIVQSARQLIGGFSATVTRIEEGLLHLRAMTSTDPVSESALRSRFPIPVSKDLPLRPLVTGVPVQIEDTETHPEMSPEWREIARLRGYRAMLNVPMIRDGAAMGLISVTRSEPGAFPAHQVELLRDFRRPGGDRHRERAPLQRDPRGARAADRDFRGAAGDQRLDRRYRPGLRQDPRQLRAPLLERAVGGLPRR